MILLVDDRPENLLPLKKILEQQSFTVDTATSGEEALKKVLRNEYFLVILDVQMPSMDGFEVAETMGLNSKTKDIPVIFLSAVKVEKKFVSKGYESGGIDYLTKPIDQEILVLKVKTFYRLYQQNKELQKTEERLKNEIKEKQIAQEELSKTNQQLKSTLETIPQVAFTANQKGEIEFVNSEWYKYSDKLNTMPASHPDDREKARQAWDQAFEKKLPIDIELRLKERTTGNYSWHLLKVIPIIENDKILKWVGTFTDINEQKLIAEKKDEFIGIASHELKTPLTSIKGYLQLLHREITGKGNNNWDKYINTAEKQIEKLTHLISDLLDVTKMESGKLKFQKTEFDFDALLQTTIETMQQLYPKYQIKNSGDQIGKIYADSGRIEQVLINYLTNAIKYSPDYHTIEVKTKKFNESYFEVRVKDYGLGIPPEKQPMIFQKFYRVEESSTRFQGMGIGLYICSEIVRRHNGSFGVESEPGKGSEFYFRLPYQKIK